MNSIPIHPSMKMHKYPVMFELYGETPLCFHFSACDSHIVGYNLFNINNHGVSLDPGIDDRFKGMDLIEGSHRLKIIGVDLV